MSDKAGRLLDELTVPWNTVEDIDLMARNIAALDGIDPSFSETAFRMVVIDKTISADNLKMWLMGSLKVSTAVAIADGIKAQYSNDYNAAIYILEDVRLNTSLERMTAAQEHLEAPSLLKSGDAFMHSYAREYRPDDLINASDAEVDAYCHSLVAAVIIQHGDYDSPSFLDTTLDFLKWAKRQPDLEKVLSIAFRINSLNSESIIDFMESQRGVPAPLDEGLI